MASLTRLWGIQQAALVGGVCAMLLTLVGDVQGDEPQAVSTSAAKQSTSSSKLPVVFKDDFQQGIKNWQTTDDSVWQNATVTRDGKPTKVLRVTGKSGYQPPVRSPHSIAWLKGHTVGDFELTVRAANTNLGAGGHRDLCLFWGRQDASHFYYVHLGAKADPHSCQIFIVNGKPRTKITTSGASGTEWGGNDKWHTLRVRRDTASGTIEVYFDDMTKPHLVAKDKTFLTGQIGLGTFDDNGNFDDVQLRARLIKADAGR